MSSNGSLYRDDASDNAKPKDKSSILFNTPSKDQLQVLEMFDPLSLKNSASNNNLDSQPAAVNTANSESSQTGPAVPTRGSSIGDYLKIDSKKADLAPSTSLAQKQAPSPPPHRPMGLVGVSLHFGLIWCAKNATKPQKTLFPAKKNQSPKPSAASAQSSHPSTPLAPPQP